MIVYDPEDPINVAIRQQRVNNYVNRKLGVRINLDNIYGLVWGKFSHSIKSIIWNNEYFEDKLDVFGYLWLLESVKVFVLGMDLKSNKYYNLHKAMLNFLSMCQGQQ